MKKVIIGFIGTLLLGICFFLLYSGRVNVTWADPIIVYIEKYSSNISNQNGILNQTIIPPCNLTEKIVEVDYLADELKNISKILRNVSDSHTYHKGYPIWDCTDFSKDLVRQLNESGYSAKCYYGLAYGKQHTWVALSMDYKGMMVILFINGEIGEFIGYEDYRLNYKKQNEGWCI